jgi:reactive intermediate/imine deaminase
MVMMLSAAVAATEAAAATPDPQYYRSPATAELGLPFSDAVRLGDLLFLSGQVGNLPGTLKLAPGGIEAEARQTLENIGALLREHGSSFDQVVKCTVFLADIAEWPAFNRVYRTFFPTNLPARSALGTGGLAIGARVEVECIAAVP